MCLDFWVNFILNTDNEGADQSRKVKRYKQYLSQILVVHTSKKELISGGQLKHHSHQSMMVSKIPLFRVLMKKVSDYIYIHYPRIILFDHMFFSTLHFCSNMKPISPNIDTYFFMFTAQLAL